MVPRWGGGEGGAGRLKRNQRSVGINSLHLKHSKGLTILFSILYINSGSFALLLREAGVSAVAIYLGYYHTCAIETMDNDRDPGIKCWGINDNNQLGEENRNGVYFRTSPFDVDETWNVAGGDSLRVSLTLSHTHSHMPLCIYPGTCLLR